METGQNESKNKGGTFLIGRKGMIGLLSKKKYYRGAKDFNLMFFFFDCLNMFLTPKSNNQTKTITLRKIIDIK